MPSRQELLESIQPDMKLTKEFFKRIYGYAYTDPEFAEEALSKLEAAGCSRAREYYQNYVREFTAWYDDQVKPAAGWIREQIDEEYERMVKEMQNDEMEVRGWQSETTHRSSSLTKQSDNLRERLNKLKRYL